MKYSMMGVGKRNDFAIRYKYEGVGQTTISTCVVFQRLHVYSSAFLLDVKRFHFVVCYDC